VVGRRLEKLHRLPPSNHEEGGDRGNRARGKKGTENRGKKRAGGVIRGKKRGALALGKVSSKEKRKEIQGGRTPKGFARGWGKRTKFGKSNYKENGASSQVSIQTTMWYKGQNGVPTCGSKVPGGVKQGASRGSEVEGRRRSKFLKDVVLSETGRKESKESANLIVEKRK